MSEADSSRRGSEVPSSIADESKEEAKKTKTKPKRQVKFTCDEIILAFL